MNDMNSGDEDQFKDPLSPKKNVDEKTIMQDRVIGMKNSVRNRNHPSESRIPIKKHYKENHYYDDFETIDWVKDISRDRIRHKNLHFGKRTILDHIKCFLDSGSGWFCVLAIGITTGLIAGIVDIGSTWLSDVRQGICWDAFWFNREQCCWSTGEENCRWYAWSELFLNKKPTGSHPDAYIIAYIFFCFWSLVFAGLCVMLVKNFAPYACGSGIPEIKTILSGFVIRGYLGKWTLLIKSVGMILGPSAGLSLGKEGPMVHMASCVGNILTNLFPKYGKNEAKKREILSASAAAGVAVAFGAPIGGVLFSLEEASYYFPMKTMFRSFFCAMVSANVLRMMNPYGSDHLVLFYVDYKAQWHVAELIPFAFLGLLGGIFGFIFNKANLKVCRMRKTTWLGKYPVREVLFVTAVTAIISFPHEYLRLNTSEMIKIMFSQCTTDSEYSICDYQKNLTDPIYKSIGNFPTGSRMTTALWLLAVGAILKTFITIFTFGIKLPAGLFIPALAVGAMIGRIVGVEMERIVLNNYDNPLVNRMCKSSEACVNPGLYAMIGAAAFLGGVTRMTISLVVVMLELTGGLNYIIPLMVASMVSKWTGDRLTNGSIYEEHIKLNNYPYLGGHDELLNNLHALDIMKPTLDTNEELLVLAEEGMRLGEVRDLIINSNVKGFPLVTSKNSKNLVGWVAKRDLILAIDKECSFETKIGLSSKVFFGETHDNGDFINEFEESSERSVSLNLQHVVDLSPVTVTYQTPMETIVDFFKKLGLRQVVVIKNGLLLGIITKKDILNKIHNNNGINL